MHGAFGLNGVIASYKICTILCMSWKHL